MQRGLGMKITDLERCVRDGITLTELRTRREQVAREMAGPAMDAYRKALAEHLVNKGRYRVKRPKSVGVAAHF